MLVTIVFPIADLRSLAIGQLGKLGRPDWMVPDTENDFIRSFGPVRQRLLGGGNDYLREGFFCSGTRVAGSTSNQIRSTLGPHAGLTNSFCRLFSDGSVVSKLEIGLIFGSRTKSIQNKSNILQLISKILSSELSVAPEEQPVRINDFGKQFASFYRRATTFTKVLENSGDANSELVSDCAPLIICHMNERERIGRPPSKHKLELDRITDYQLYHSRLKAGGRQRRIWSIDSASNGRTGTSRLLRMYLIRLYTEHQILRYVLRNLDHPMLASQHDHMNSNLQAYLNQSTRKIARMSRRSSGVVGHELGTIAREAEDTIRPGDIAMLQGKISSLEIRSEISKKADEYIRRDATVFVTVKQGGVLSMTRETHNQNINFGKQETVQQAGSDSKQTVNQGATQDNTDEITKAISDLKQLIDEMKSDPAVESMGDIKKSLSHLETEFGETDAPPDKGIILKATERLADTAGKLEKYAEPIGKIVGVIRKFAGA